MASTVERLVVELGQAVDNATESGATHAEIIGALEVVKFNVLHTMVE